MSDALYVSAVVYAAFLFNGWMLAFVLAFCPNTLRLLRRVGR